MIYQSPINPNSHLTAKERKWVSYPTKQLFSQNLITGKVLDFGCGLGTDVTFLKEQNLETTAYDPHYTPDYPREKFDTIICNYVLNVLLPEEQSHVLMTISELLKPTGKAYFTVRRDIKKNGFRFHIKHNCQVYQCNVVLPYKSILKADHCEIYEYQHINQLKKDNSLNCLFCQPDPTHKLITESAMVYAIFAEQDLSEKQVLIIPKQHTANYFDLPDKTKLACWLVAKRIIQQFQTLHYNISFGTQEVSNSHVCIHLTTA